MKKFFIPTFLALAACVSTQSAGAAVDFASWLDGLKRDAQAAGIPKATIDDALQNIHPVPRIIELDQKQPETTITLKQYLSQVVVPARTARGKKLLVDNGPMLRAVSAEYGVPAKTIMALWAIESSFGQSMGAYRVVDALATLAYDGRRPDLFRAELISALKILGKGGIRSADMKGSWAGAMGQTQFMPSTYLKYAVDFQHQGEPDIWHNTGDVFASAANYLAQLGWNRDETWGREVKLPKRFDSAMVGLPVKHSVSEWSNLGVRRADGTVLPASTIEGSVIAPDGNSGRAFLVYDNFRTIMKWNHSTYFALAVGLLGDSIGAR